MIQFKTDTQKIPISIRIEVTVVGSDNPINSASMAINALN
jgi:hypothetical protein